VNASSGNGPRSSSPAKQGVNPGIHSSKHVATSAGWLCDIRCQRISYIRKRMTIPMFHALSHPGFESRRLSCTGRPIRSSHYGLGPSVALGILEPLRKDSNPT
jgi:hypothetical protein